MKLAYMMSRFPLLSETFILRELSEMERRGWQIALYPLICLKPEVIHRDAQHWLARMNCIPYLSSGVILENMRAFFMKPLTYLSLWLRMVWHNLPSLNFLLRGLILFPKAVYTAARMRDEGITHIHAHYATHPALVAWVIHHLTGISYSITVHSHDIYDRQAMLEPKLRDATFVAAISQFNVEFLSGLVGGWIRAKTHVIHCGIETEQYRSIPAPEGATSTGRQTSHVKKDFEIIHIGSLHWKKGQVHLLEAVALLRDEGVAVRCRIIGEGPERSRLEELITRRRLNGVVELLGAMSGEKVIKLLWASDCYVQPSVSEGIPVAIMEAMASELPVIATGITGISELVRDGHTGHHVPPADVPALADAIRSLINDPAGARRMARAGRDFVSREFDLHKSVGNLEKLFRQVTIDQEARAA